MQALLEDAIECLFFRGVTAGCQRENMQQDAVIWLRGGREAPFSFDRVCEVLGMDAEALRAELFRRLQLVRRGGDCAPRTMHRPAVNGRQTRIVATRVRPGMAPTA